MSKLNAQEKKESLTNDERNQFLSLLKRPLEMDTISPDNAQQLITLVESGQMSVKEASSLVNDLVSES